MRDVQQALKEFTEAFQSHGVDHPKRQAEELLEDLLHLSRIQLYTHFEQPLQETEWLTCQAWLKRRLNGEPLAHITGQISFYNCLIQVTPQGLIPRQETEILVDHIAKILQHQDLSGMKLWDLCCGTGCIGIALKKKFADLTVTLSDISAEALALAQANAECNQVDVRCLQGDLLAPFKGEKAHFIVCNPPYVSEEEYQQLETSVKLFEPRLALVGGLTGLEFYRRLADEMPYYLESAAKIWLEVGYQQGEEVKKIFENQPWTHQQLFNDWAGHHRFFFLENE